MKELKEENAVIERVTLGKHPHYQVMEMWVFVKYSGGGQGIGGYALDNYDEGMGRRVGTGYGLDFIIQVLDTVGVDTINELKDKSVRVRHEGLGGKAVAIGHYLQDKWFTLEDHAQEWKEKVS